jgi:hypothetical protein
MLLLVCTAWLSGCAQQVKVSGGWQEGASHKQSFDRVLVVGVSPNVNERCAFEYFLAAQINGGSTVAIRSCDAVAEKNPLTLESIEQAVASQRADAVLATVLVEAGWDAQQGGTRDTRGGAYYKAVGSGWGTGYYGIYGVPVIYGEFQTAPSLITLQGQVQLTTRLYSTADKTAVYEVSTVAEDLEARDEALAKVTAPIAEQLRRQGLIR